ncbi:FtsK/SpoIIIE domain-containing protein [Microbacterium sp. 4NA327F11]|uniref:FtsK/SpoIIIE domain-containing protein n=1 Tax=Microbacterium sp. 4NA327F11 TaxID=2502229 RepID=UPI001485AD20|nr:FtsK/SpoIIIE domain-containing protein [Microbacterium sp. 4NA327F11]
MAIERLHVPVGENFDPNASQHLEVLLAKVEETGRGTGWEVQSLGTVDGKRTVTLTRRSLLTRVDLDQDAQRGSSSYKVELKRGTKPADGEKVAADLEIDPAHAGYFMTKFDPFINQATLTRLNEAELRCRSACANALGVKPWDVQVRGRRDGGFTLTLPASYTPSKHDDKLTEVAELIVGRPGWYFTSNPSTLTAEIIPSIPPTFAPIVGYPLEILPRPAGESLAPLPIGEALADRGDQANETMFLDFAAAPHMQLGGIAGAGKSTTLNAIIAGALGAGAELAIIDVPQKAVDFDAWRPFVRPGGWGCESYEENATTLELLYREGERRAQVFKRYGVKKLSELPADLREGMREVVIVVDELTGLFSMDTVPKRLDGDDPLRREAESRNYARELIRTYIEKIAAEQRFVGYHLVVSTQVATTNTGISTALRTNLPHKIILGPRATEANRRLLLTDVTSAPTVPEHIRNDEAASRGVGVAELAGQRPRIFKSYFSSEHELINELRSRGVRELDPSQLDATRPSPKDVHTRFPDLADVVASNHDREQPQFGRGPRTLEAWEVDPETGQPLTGFARANAARRAVTEAAHG